jgi:glycosyltransferase involved in cell wall biosynthesis
VKSELQKKKRLLIFVVAYNAQHTINWVLGRIPSSLAKEFDAEILVIDDQSDDNTFEESEGFAANCESEFKITVLFNPENQGYGGNQKIGYHYAIKNNFDFVALIHGDGQYAPEELPTLIKPLAFGEADAVFGSRMLSNGAALKGGMPLYKFIGNKILTFFQNYMLQTKFSEFHSGYRLYSTSALRTIPFHLNSDDFHFDTEIIIQLVFSRKKIRELPIPNLLWRRNLSR